MHTKNNGMFIIFKKINKILITKGRLEIIFFYYTLRGLQESLVSVEF